MKANVTISEVSKKAGVSKSTISNYLNGRYERMSEETKHIIEETIKELGYTPNLSARRLPNKEKSRTVCLIIPRNLTRLFDSMYYPKVFHSIEKLAEKEDYNILIYSRNRKDMGNEMIFLKGLASSLVDGFIIFDLDEKDKFFKEFEKAGIPYVCVGKIYGYDDYHYVASDHEMAMVNVLEYLLQLGHKKIGIFQQDDSGVVEAVRHRAISKVCEDHQDEELKIERFKIPVKATDQTIYDVWYDLLNKEDGFTAFVISSAIQKHMLMAVSALGLSIPEDISYVNIEYYSRNDLGKEVQTRVESKASIIAEMAFKKLLKLINNTSADFESELVSLDLTIGSTTAIPKQ